MTLNRQIVLVPAIVFLIIFCGLFVLYNYNTEPVVFLGWLLGLYVFALIVIICAVRMLLRPLHDLSQQAESIIHHQFILQEKIPQAQEFKKIGKAMNAMISRSQKKCDEEILLIEQLHQQIYQDPVTGLGNRRYFDSRRRLLVTQKVKFGALLLMEFQGIKQYNDAEGYLKGDELIRNIGEVIKENSQDIKENFLARIGGSTFAIFTPHLSNEEVTHLATCLIHAIEEMLSSKKETRMIAAHIGIASLAGIKNATQLLTVADAALQDAQNRGAFIFSQHDNDNESTNMAIRSAIEWKNYIEQIINDNLVTVVYQPIISFKDKSIMSYEALLRVKGEERNLTEACFIIPMADRYGLTHTLDRCIIQQVLARVKAADSQIPYVINLSSCTLTHKPTLEWLCKILATGEYSNKLILEFGEHTALNNLSLLKNTMEQLKPYGIALGIEHYGYDFSGFDFLKNLKPLYLKIDGSYIGDLNNQNTQFFIHFLTKIAHTMDIQVIAECLESEFQWNILQSFHLDGAQGEFLALPEPENTY